MLRIVAPTAAYAGSWPRRWSVSVRRDSTEGAVRARGMSMSMPSSKIDASTSPVRSTPSASKASTLTAASASRDSPVVHCPSCCVT